MLSLSLPEEGRGPGRVSPTASLSRYLKEGFSPSLNSNLSENVQAPMLPRRSTLIGLFSGGLVLALSAFSLGGQSRGAELAYKPARIDNPLKGLIPGSYGTVVLKLFPHS